MSLTKKRLSSEEADQLLMFWAAFGEVLEYSLRRRPLSVSEYRQLNRLSVWGNELKAKIRHTRLITKEDERAFSAAIRYLKEMDLQQLPPDIYEKAFRIISEFGAERIYPTLESEIAKKINESKANGRKLNVVFMFGSGASRPNPSNIPTVNEMLDYLVSKFPPTEIPFANKVREWATGGGVNIEDILTAGYLSTLLISKPVVNKLIGEIIYREVREKVAELREREYVFSFQDLTNRVFSMVSGLMAQAESNAIHDSVAELIKDFKDDAFLEFAITTTNYDVCVEKAFGKNGLQYTYLGIEDEAKGIPIVKIHGSVNWFYCEGCQSVITYSVKELEAFKKIFPTSGSCQKCGTPTSLFMVPPIAYKYVMYPPLIDIWQAAMRTIERADLIVVIGYSFGLADDYFFKMVVNGIKKNNSTLVMLDRSLSSIDNLENKLSAYHLKLPFAVNGDAVETVPKLLNAIKAARNKAEERIGEGAKKTG